MSFNIKKKELQEKSNLNFSTVGAESMDKLFIY